MLLVRSSKRLPQLRGVGQQRQRDLRVRAGIAQVDQPLEALLAHREAFVMKRGSAVGFEHPVIGIERGRIDIVEMTLVRAHVVMFRLREQHAERAEQTRQRRDENPAHAEQARERRRVHRPVAAEREQRKLARIAAALGRHRAQRPRHRGVRNAVHAPRRVIER